MDFKRCTDAELIKKMITAVQSHSEIDEIWQEFAQRFEKLFIYAIKETYKSYIKVEAIRREDIYDLLQTIFTKLMKDEFSIIKKIEIASADSVQRYFYVAASNITKNWMRDSHRIKRNYSLTSSLDEQVLNGEGSASANVCLYDKRANPEERLIQKERIEQLFQIIDSESRGPARARNKKIFMAYLEGYTVEEIVALEDINMAVTGVKSIIARTKKKLEEYYGQAK
jgi:RNA polymerase sigma factor (sigma-70 family)